MGVKLRPCPYHMITHGDEEVEEQFAAMLHLALHRAAPLEGVAAADDESEVVCSKFRVRIRGVAVRPACRGQDGRNVDAGLQTLLPESETLEFIEAIADCGTAENQVRSNAGSQRVSKRRRRTR